jgi:methyl-accepting chemotaxis protein
MDIVQALIASVPYIKEIMREEVMITIFDDKEYVFYSPSNELDFKHKKGDPLPPKYVDFQMVDPNKTVVVPVPAEEFGVSFDSISLPIKNEEGRLVAGMNVAVSRKRQEKLEEIMDTMQGISSQLLDKIQHIAAHSEELSASSEQISENAKYAVENSAKVTDVTSVIRGISEQTNLLGLNAAIEAARVGAEGAGFGVVANEVRKLSLDTKQATTNIESSLSNIKNSIEKMQLDFNDINDSSQQEVKLITEFMDDIEKLNKTSEEMKSFMAQLVTYE